MTFNKIDFVAVYYLDDGKVVDRRKNWIEAGGQSEHSWFARPGKKHPPPKPTRSAKLTKMLGPQLHEAPSSSSQLGVAAFPGSTVLVSSGNPIVRINDSPASSQDILPERHRCG